MITLDKETKAILIETEFQSLCVALKPQGHKRKMQVFNQAVESVENLLKDEQKFTHWLKRRV